MRSRRAFNHRGSVFEGSALQKLINFLGAATLDRLRHGAYRIVVEGEGFRKPKPIPESGENALAKSSKNRIVEAVRIRI